MCKLMTSLAPSTAHACRHLLEELNLKLPFWKYYWIFRSSPYSFLLDSATDSLKLGRFSFLGRDPFLVYRAKRVPRPGSRLEARIEILELASLEGQRLRKPVAKVYQSNPFDDLRKLMKQYSIDHDRYLSRPVPFMGGAVGYLGYESGYFVEQLPDLGFDDLGLPDVYLMFFDCLMAHCHQTGKSYLSILGRGRTEAIAHLTAQVLRDRILSVIGAFEANPPAERPAVSRQQAVRAKIEVKAHFDELKYCRAVTKMKDYILAGDIFQACLTHRLESPLDGGGPWDLYEELRRITPSPFACYLNFPEAQVVSASPERFLSLDENGIAESRPIKGTRPRGRSSEEDEQFRQDLLCSSKDRAENAMIVDLVRSDLGRVCKFHTVTVPEFMVIEPYATVFQMVSTIRGQLKPGLSGIDLIKACFPGGSMTGAPKIEAMKIIDRLEPVKRGIYSGSVGYLDFAGPLDFNIVIRSFVVKDRRCYYNVGGAIVADSDPRGEYAETMDKARALKVALANLKSSGLPASN
jgi:para-aminobenzoate synthetase component I